MGLDEANTAHLKKVSNESDNSKIILPILKCCRESDVQGKQSVKVDTD